MSFRVRSSKFRHVFGSVYKKESCYEGIKITKNAHDNNFCEVNPKFLSVVTESAGGGSFLVLPLEKVGRVDANCPKVCGHTGPILDVKWNPFSDQVIASASDDATVKIWQIPENGLDTTLTDWMVDLHGHTRRVGYLDWHPTAENVLLSAGYDFNCILWNVETAEPVNILSLHPDNIFSIGWNYDGSMFATTCKDKNLRVIDPRLGNIVSECAGHQGSKASKVKFLGNRNKLFSVGFSRLSDRQYALWDMRNMSKPMRMESIDTSSGIMWPFCDYDTNVVFVAGKGDGNIRYFELVGDAPYIHYLSQYQSGSPQRGLGVMPKRGLDTSRCEMMRFYKLHSVKALVEPISMIVPRKSEMFQDDIYPPTSSLLPSLSADEWIAGSNRDPILMSLKDGQIIASTRSSTGKALQRKDGGIVPTPTITTYKAIKRGQSVTEAPSVKRSSPMTKAMSVDRPDSIPASVKNIAKLSTVGESGDTGQGIDVFNKIGMFEKKTQHNSPPERQWSSGQQKEGSPDKQWTTGYQSTVKTEVTTPTQSPADESSPLTTYQPSPSSNHNSARGGTSRQQGVTIAQHSPIFERPPPQRKISPQQEQPSNSSLFSVRGESMTTELFSDDSDTLSPDNGLATSQSQLAAKKRSRRTHSYRRRRENRILNESSDQDMFSTPPTSPAIKTQAWNENPVFGTDNAVDISALDDALNDFEILTKSFHPSTDQAGVRPETTAECNRVPQSKPTVSNPLSKSEKQLDSSRSSVPKEEIVASKSMTNIGSVLELQAEVPSSDSPQLLSSKLSQSAHTIQSFGATSELTSPEPSGNSELTEMIDFINTDAPDNTLIKPSKLRASMKSKRRLTQEILQPGGQQRRSSFDSSPSPGPRQGSHSPSPGPTFKAKSQTQLQHAGSPEDKWNGLHRAGSLREKVAKDAELTESSMRRAQSLRDRSRSNTKQKQMTIVERNSGTKPSQELNNNNKMYDISGKISPRTISRPLQLALDLGTSKTSTQSIGERSKSFEATSPVIHQEKAAQRQDSFKSTTKVQLNSPVHNAPESPVHMYPSRSARVQSHSPTHLSQPVQTGNLQFTTGTTQDRTSPDKFLFSPTDGSRSSPSLVNSLQGSFPGQLLNGPGDTDNKIHVKKVWSPRSPSQSEPVLENGETHGLPTTDPELRKAYFRQLEEIQSLKQQITFKDKRIRQLEDELRLLRLPSSPELGESVC